MLPRIQFGQRTTCPSWCRCRRSSRRAERHVAAVPQQHRDADRDRERAGQRDLARCRSGDRQRASRGPRRAVTQARISTTHSGPSVRSPASSTTDRVAAASSQRSRRSSAASTRRGRRARAARSRGADPGRHLQAVRRRDGGRVEERRGEPDEQADEGPRPPGPGGQAPRGERQHDRAEERGHGAHGVERVGARERLTRRADHPVVDRLVVRRRGRARTVPGSAPGPSPAQVSGTM